jgi:hypothetical protein
VFDEETGSRPDIGTPVGAYGRNNRFEDWATAVESVVFEDTKVHTGNNDPGLTPTLSGHCK